MDWSTDGRLERHTNWFVDGCVDVWMGGWMDDGGTDGRLDRHIHGLVDGFVDVWMGGWMDGWTNGQTERYRQTDWLMDGWINEMMDGWMDRLIDLRTDRRIEARKNERTDEKKRINLIKRSDTYTWLIMREASHVTTTHSPHNLHTYITHFYLAFIPRNLIGASREKCQIYDKFRPITEPAISNHPHATTRSYLPNGPLITAADFMTESALDKWEMESGIYDSPIACSHVNEHGGLRLCGLGFWCWLCFIYMIVTVSGWVND